MTTIRVRCTGCEDIRNIPLGSHQPFCIYCGSPMIAIKVNAGGRKKQRKPERSIGGGA